MIWKYSNEMRPGVTIGEDGDIQYSWEKYYWKLQGHLIVARQNFICLQYSSFKARVPWALQWYCHGRNKVLLCDGKALILMLQPCFAHRPANAL